MKSNSLTQSSNPSLSRAWISQFVESQSPWIIESGVFDHIYAACQELASHNLWKVKGRE